MAKSETIRARVDPELKARAEGVLSELGLTASEAIRLFDKQVALRKGLPFDVVIPDATTRRALREVEQGRGLTRDENTDELFDAIGR